MQNFGKDRKTDPFELVQELVGIATRREYFHLVTEDSEPPIWKSVTTEKNMIIYEKWQIFALNIVEITKTCIVKVEIFDIM